MVVPGFQGSFIHVNQETGNAVSGYWPGLALLMTPFAWFKAEWMLNPLLGAVGLWLIDGWLAADVMFFTLWWAGCAGLTCLVVLFALHDALAVIREERGKHQ